MPADPTANSNRLGPASKRSLGETRQATLSSEPPLDCPFAAPFPALARACLRWRESKPRRAMAASQPKTRCGVRSPGSVKREWRGVECRESRWTPGDARCLAGGRSALPRQLHTSPKRRACSQLLVASRSHPTSFAPDPFLSRLQISVHPWPLAGLSKELRYPRSLRQLAR
jgi:hypothetical protein